MKSSGSTPVEPTISAPHSARHHVDSGTDSMSCTSCGNDGAWRPPTPVCASAQTEQFAITSTNASKQATADRPTNPRQLMFTAAGRVGLFTCLLPVSPIACLRIHRESPSLQIADLQIFVRWTNFLVEWPSSATLAAPIG
eukprot:scpid68171/ scgid18302/ 